MILFRFILFISFLRLRSYLHNAKYIKPLLPQFAEFDFYWHTIDVSRKGLAYSGISLISPEMFDTLIDMIKNKEGLQELEQLLTKAKVENKYVIHFGI